MRRREFIASVATVCAIGSTKGKGNIVSPSSDLVLTQTMYWSRFRHSYSRSGSQLWGVAHCIEVDGEMRPYIIFGMNHPELFEMLGANVPKDMYSYFPRPMPEVVTVNLYTEPCPSCILISEAKLPNSTPDILFVKANGNTYLPGGLWRLSLFPLLQKHDKLYLELKY